MGNFAFRVPALGTRFVDYRVPIPGDSFNWAWIRPLSQVRYLTIHHTAGPDTQTPDQIANYHINTNGWGGVGYHFIISKEGVAYYVGDLTTARANVKDMNEQVIGICLVGNFMSGKVPPEAQIRATSLLCTRLLFETPELPNVNGWEDVVGHKQLQATACPGDSWESWKGRLIGVSRSEEITNLYKTVLGRQPDQAGFTYWLNSGLTVEVIRKNMVESEEHRQILVKAGRLG